MDTEKPEIDTGDDAFPVPHNSGRTGMSLLDYFAGQALAGFTAKGTDAWLRRAQEKFPNASAAELLEAMQVAIARNAYDLAEAMVKRKRELEGS